MYGKYMTEFYLKYTLCFLLTKEEKRILNIWFYQVRELGKSLGSYLDTLSLPSLHICEIGGNNSYQMNGWKEDTDGQEG